MNKMSDYTNHGYDRPDDTYVYADGGAVAATGTPFVNSINDYSAARVRTNPAAVTIDDLSLMVARKVEEAYKEAVKRATERKRKTAQQAVLGVDFGPAALDHYYLDSALREVIRELKSVAPELTVE